MAVRAAGTWPERLGRAVPVGRDRGGQLLCERDERAVAVLRQAQVREEPRHEHALAEVADPRLGPFAARERDRELRVSASGRAWQRERAPETRVYVRDRQRPVRLAETLDVCR